MKLGFHAGLNHHSRLTQSHPIDSPRHSDRHDPEAVIQKASPKLLERVVEGAKASVGRQINQVGDERENSSTVILPKSSRPVPEADNPKVAASKAIAILSKREKAGYCRIEGGSIYGAAIAMPQIARSSGWPGTFLTLVIRVYFFLVVNVLLQGFLLSMIGEEQLMWYPFAGKMHLCDFGSNIKDCPDAANCKGPLGTPYSAPRLYDYDIWSTRIFIKDSLKAIFPDKAEELDKAVDPGEYGMENYYCRLACIFLFMLAVVDDLSGSWHLMKTLWYVPTAAESWIEYDLPDWASKDDVKMIQEAGELDFVIFKVAGIPLHWKIINCLGVLLPKLALWLALVKSGVHYLMETAGIVDVIVNAMALTFVLEVDEMMFNRFSSSLTKHIMMNIVDKPLFSTDDEEEETEQDALKRFNEEELGSNRWWKVIIYVTPVRFIMVCLLQAFFMYEYYWKNCDKQQDGSLVSKAMSVPASLEYSPFKLMFGFEGERTDEHFWVMPD